MNNQPVSAIIPVFFAFLLCCNTCSADVHRVTPKQRVRVLYVQGTTDYWGEAVDPGRGEDFRRFLERNFIAAKVVKDIDFTPELARDVDVMIVDGDIREKLPYDFLRPMVLLGGDYCPIGIPERFGYKLHNSCRCLSSEELHTVRSDHAIFKGPLPVRPTLFDDVDPVTHHKVRAWKTHEPIKYKDREFFVKGMTASGPVLYQAADSEIIAGGMNSKGDYAVALAREANFFHWGPVATPSQMNEEARRVFINAIVYMKKFDGARQTVWRNVQPRSLLPVEFNILRELVRRQNTSKYELNAISQRVNLRFPPELVKRFGANVEKYASLFEPNIAYVYVPHGGTWYQVDEEAKSIGIPNNDIRFLAKCIDMLDSPAEAPKAERLLERYTHLAFVDTKAWQQWFASNADKLYFSDGYDYRFHTGPAGPPPDPREVQIALVEMSMAEPGDALPVSAGGMVVGYVVSQQDATVGSDGKSVNLAYQPGGYTTNKGALVSVVVRLKIAQGWHIVASVTDSTKQDQPTFMRFDLPVGARWYGEWQMPNGHEVAKPGIREYRGDVVFTRHAYFTELPKEGLDALGRARIALRGTVQYQPCNQQRCFALTWALLDTAIVVADN